MCVCAVWLHMCVFVCSMVAHVSSVVVCSVVVHMRVCGMVAPMCVK